MCLDFLFSIILLMNIEAYYKFNDHVNAEIIIIIYCNCLGCSTGAGGYPNEGGAKANKPGKEPDKTTILHVLFV